MHQFGEDCEIAIGDWTSDSTFSNILKKDHEFIKRRMPYRERNDLPKIAGESYLITRCYVDFSKIKSSLFSWLSLGPVMGESAVFVNDELRMTLDDNDVAEFPLLEKDKSNRSVITVISKNTKEERPGLATLIPPVFSDKRSDFSRIERLLSSWSIEIPVFRIGFALALLVVFAACWVFGLRYKDVSWVIVILGLLVATSLVEYFPAVTDIDLPLKKQVLGFLSFGLALAMGSFVYRFLRIKSRLFHPELITVGVLAFFGVVLFNISAKNLLLSELTGQLQTRIGGAYMILVPIIALFSKKNANAFSSRRKIQRTIILTTTIIAGICYLVESSILQTTGIFLTPIVTYGMAFAYSFLLSIELVVYEKEYFREKTQRLIDEEKSKTDRALAQMTQMVAHDVRKPLVILRQLVNKLTLDNSNPDFSTLKEHLNKSIQSAEGMLEDIMMVSPQVKLQVAKLSVEELLRDVTGYVLQNSFFANKKEIEIIWEFKHKKYILVNSRRIRRVFINIIENAIQAVPGRGTLRISTRDIEEGVDCFTEISIWNSGSFISEEDHERIFERFFTSGKKTGTGLGLAVAKTIVNEHGGTINVDSNVGAGTDFKIKLPSAADNFEAFHKFEKIAQSATCLEDMVKSSARPLLVIVEDDPFVRDAWIEAVDDAEIITFENPSEFFERLRREENFLEKISIIVTDMHFSNDDVWDGKSFAQKLKEQNLSCPIYLSSCSDPSHDPGDCFDAVIEKKTFNFAQLLRLRGKESKAS